MLTKLFHWNIWKKFNKYSNISMNLFYQWTDENAVTVPAIIPWQGPFHVALNVEDSIVLMFWLVFFFLETLQGSIWPKQKVSKKTRAKKISTVTTAAFVG